ATQAFQHRPGTAGVQQRATGGDGAHRTNQVGTVDLLEDVPGRTRHDGVVERVLIGERGEHEAGDLGVVRTDVPAHLHTRPAGKAHVEDGHVRQDHGDTRERLLSGTRLTHHGHVVLDLQESRHTAAHDLVIVHEEDPDLFPGALAV